MKKILSIFLVLAMLLTTFAMAAGPGVLVMPENTEEIPEIVTFEPEEQATVKTDDLAFLESAKLIYSDDFESYNDGDVIAKDSTVSPNFVAEGYSAKYTTEGNSAVAFNVMQEGNGNKYLDVTKSGRWDMLTVVFPNDLREIGDYYFISSFYVDDNATSVFSAPAQMTVYTNGKGGDGHLFQSYAASNGAGWVRCIRKIEVIGQAAAEEAGVTFTNGVGDKYSPVAWIDKMYCYSTTATDVSTSHMKLDNIALYFVPAGEPNETATVTFHKNTEDSTATVPTAVTVDKMSRIKLADYTATTETDNLFRGWSTAPGGEAMAQAEFYVTEDTNLYAVWSGKYVIPGYDWEMPAIPNGFNGFGNNGGAVFNVEYVYDDDDNGTVTAMKISQGKPSTGKTRTLTKDGVQATYEAAYDPLATISTNIPASTVSSIEFRLKFVTPYDERKAGTGFQMFYTTDLSTNLQEAKSFSFNVVGDGNYAVYTIDPSTKSTWSGIIKSLRIDPLNDYYPEEALYIDYIKFNTATEIPTSVTEGITFTPANGSTNVDYRDPRVYVTFAFTPRASLEAVAAAYGMEGISFDSSTNTYVLCPSIPNLAGNTLSAQGSVVYGNGVNYLMPSYSITYTSQMPTDGENLMPNGQFDYNWTKGWNSSAIKYLETGVMTTNVTGNGNKYNSTNALCLKLEEGTAENPKRYYVEYRARLNPTSYADYTQMKSSTVYNSSGQTTTVAAPAINVYWPLTDGRYSSSGTNTVAWDRPTYIKGITQSGLNTGGVTDSNWKTRSAVFLMKDSTFYGSSNYRFTFQACSNGGPYYYDAEKTQSACYPTAGLSFDFDYVIVKEMYAINFDKGAETAEGDGIAPYYYAKGNTIILPSECGYTNGDFGFSGWMYNGTFYTPGSEITLDTTGDITLTAEWAAGLTYTDGTNEVSIGTITYPYTIPSTVDGIVYNGENAENYVLDYWEFGTEKFIPGTVYTEEQGSQINGKVLTAVFADKTQNAMGYSYEGDSTDGASAYKAHSYKTVVEDGVTSFFAEWSYLNMFKPATGKYENDMRITFTLPEKSGTEFSLFKMRYKIKDIVNYTYDADTETHTPMVQSKATLRGYMSGTRGLYSESQRFLGQDTDNDNTYRVISKNMFEMTNATDGFVAQGGVKYIWIDPALSHGGNAYIDYVRLYRAGVHKVTYNANAPEGSEVTAEVLADTGVGIGAGYMLSGEVPVIDDSAYTFLGWATSPDATPDDVVSSVDLVGDTTVYGVWAIINAPVASDATEVRIPDGAVVEGLRFAATVTAEDKEQAIEYGYIVALTDSLGDSELTFDYSGKYAYGAAYVYGGIDKIYAMDGMNTIYTGVLTNIPENKRDTQFTARPYLKTNVGGIERIVYGDAVVSSLVETAQKMLLDAEEGIIELNEDEVDYLMIVGGLN